MEVIPSSAWALRVLEGPLYPTEDYGHHARAKRIFEDANLNKVVPDFCEVRLDKRKYTVKIEDFHIKMLADLDSSQTELSLVQKTLATKL